MDTLNIYIYIYKILEQNNMLLCLIVDEHMTNLTILPGKHNNTNVPLQKDRSDHIVKGEDETDPKTVKLEDAQSPKTPTIYSGSNQTDEKEPPGHNEGSHSNDGEPRQPANNGEYWDDQHPAVTHTNDQPEASVSTLL